MTTPEVNEGIINQGTISSQSLAVGRGARAVTTIEAAARTLEEDGHADVAQRLTELKSEMLAQRTAIENFDETLQALELLAAGLAEPEPNRLTIRSLLDGLTSSLRSVGGVANAVAALKVAVGALL
jgi:hypothetical protein